MDRTTNGAGAGKKKHKNKNPNKPKKNAFGCLDIGKACNGKNDKCCSGICQGKRPRKGKKDKSNCIAHNIGSCQANQDTCTQEDISCGLDAFCFQTTGKASFCGLAEESVCTFCAKDRDCEERFGPGAACVVCAECFDDDHTLCIQAFV